MYGKLGRWLCKQVIEIDEVQTIQLVYGLANVLLLPNDKVCSAYPVCKDTRGYP